MRVSASFALKNGHPLKDGTGNQWNHMKSNLYKGRHVYLMLLPVIIYYLVFHYAPLYGVLIAFKDYKPLKGIMGSPWIGFANFIDFFNSFYFIRLLRNTLVLSFYSILFGFPAPILLALMLNEVKSNAFKRTVQTISYLPHFVSLIVIVGMIIDFLSTGGLVNSVLAALGGQPVKFLSDPAKFRAIYVISGIWQEAGWGSIIYLSSLTSIDTQLYEAAYVDGAGRWKQLLHVTLPGIAPTVVILLILRLGNVMTVGFEKVILMQNPMNMESSDIISTFVYTRGLLQADYSYSTAVGLFNSAVNFILLLGFNKLSRRLSESSLW